MKIVRFDSVGGASGDMILGALIGLGASRDELQKALGSLNAGDFEIIAYPFQSHGISGVQASVNVHKEHDRQRHDPHDHDHDHYPHEHGHKHDHEHAHGHARAHDHEHRAWADIERMILSSGLPERVKNASRAVFQRLAEAEAKIHGTTPEKVHFHEVGAVDSIVDIVGSCLALHFLGAEGVAVGPLPMGHGTITCAHGTYPSPAPATAELLKGQRVLDVDEPFELVTPTGAALLAAWPRAAASEGRLLATANSFGHRRLQSRPNLLRAMLIDVDAEPARSDECLVLECNLDDTNPELVGALTERLLAAGAWDVFTSAVQMKKQRPGILLTVLCDPSKRERALDLIFRESTTLGVREHLTRRAMLERRWETVQTLWGDVRVKIGCWKGEDVTRAPEMDDCVRLAREKQVAARAVYESAQQAIRAKS